MLPRLYSFSTNINSYSNNGYGPFTTCTSCEIVEALNGDFTLALEILQQDRLVKYIKPGMAILAKPDPSNKPEQIYIITNVNISKSGRLSIQAVHVKSMFFNNVLYGDVDDSGYSYSGTPEQIFQLVENELAVTNDFSFSSPITKSGTIELGIEAVTLGDLFTKDGGMLEVFGAEMSYDNFNVSMLPRRGKSTPNEELKYGFNISSYSVSMDNLNEYTHVVPYANVPVKSTYQGNESAIRLYGDTIRCSPSRFTKVLTVDFSDRFKSKKGYVNPNPVEGEDSGYAEAKARINRYALRYINKRPSIYNSMVGVSIEANSSLDMNRLRLGDSVIVDIEPLNYKKVHRVTETVYDCIAEKYKSITLGDRKFTLYNVLRGGFLR